MNKYEHKIVIKDGDSTCTYRQSNMCHRLFGWYAPEALTKAEVSTLIECGLMAQKDKSFKIELSAKENSRLIRLECVYVAAWIECGCKVWGKKPKIKAIGTSKTKAVGTSKAEKMAKMARFN
jgi:hypothetical protein